MFMYLLACGFVAFTSLLLLGLLYLWWQERQSSRS